MDKIKRKALQRELKAVEDAYAGTLDWLELGELRSWVEAGNSPYENPEQVIHEDGTFFDFIEWHRTARWVTVREPLDLRDLRTGGCLTFIRTDALTMALLRRQKSTSGMHRPFWAVRSSLS